MATQFSSVRHQAALSIPTAYKRYSRFVFSRGGSTVELEPTAGSLTQDVRRSGRWDGRLTFVGNALIPRLPSDILAPFGTRVSVTLGIQLLDETISSVPYGTFEIATTRTMVEADARTVEIGLVDVSDRVERYRFENPLTVASGTDLATLINTVITNRVGISPNVSATGSTLGVARTLGLETGTGPWSELLDILASFGRTAWYDRTGAIQVGFTAPDPSTTYPLDALTSISSDFDTRPPNVIVARGEPQDGSTPVQATAIDDDPGSPTYAGTGPGTSPYGRVTRFFASPLLTTVAQAQAAADTIRDQHIGQGATYTLVRPFDPTVDGGDVVSLDGLPLVVDAVTVNLTGDTTLQARGLQ